MWLLSTSGFVSVVCKPEDRERGTLTVRARVARDLEELRDRYLPELGEIVTTPGADYRYRAQVPRAAFAAAVGRMAAGIEYGNFKHAVQIAQGDNRASVYEEVWSLLGVLADESIRWTREQAPEPGSSAHGSS